MALKLGFSEEVHAPIDHQHKSLRPFIPEIISSGGGGASLKYFSFILVEDDDVDTSLTLSTDVSRIPSPPIYNSPNLDEVETALKLTSKTNVSPLIYDPTPLRCFFPPQNIPEASSSVGPRRTAKGKRKRADDGESRARGSNKGKKRRGNGVNDGDNQRPLLPPVEEFPALVRALESRKGSRAVFLYRKKLTPSDVRGDLHRLFMTEREPLMNFLTAEEAAAVDGTKQGIEVLGLDQFGKGYGLVLKTWGSIHMTVINADWAKMVAANAAGEDDLVEIWGFRQEDGKLGFAILFGRSA